MVKFVVPAQLMMVKFVVRVQLMRPFARSTFSIGLRHIRFDALGL